jgi:glucan-binding YG repeat protein
MSDDIKPDNKGSKGQGRGKPVSKITCLECSSEVTKAIDCGRCKEKLCLKCMDLTESDYKVACKRTNMILYCSKCLDKTMKLNREDFVIEQRCEKYLQSVHSRLEAMQIELDNKVSKTDLKDTVKSTVEEVLQAQIQETVQSQIQANTKETRLREQKKNNLIVFNIPECEGVDDSQTDIEYFDKLCKEDLKVQVNVASANRIGTKNDEQLRPVILRMGDVQQKGQVLKKAKELDKLEDQTKKNIYIKPDLTPQQRKESAELRRQRDQKQQESDSKNEAIRWIIRKGKLIDMPVTPGLEIPEEDGTE